MIPGTAIKLVRRILGYSSDGSYHVKIRSGPTFILTKNNRKYRVFGERFDDSIKFDIFSASACGLDAGGNPFTIDDCEKMEVVRLLTMHLDELGIRYCVDLKRG